MLIVKKVNAYIGLLLATIATCVSPIIKVPFKGNWNLYQTDSRLFFITISIIALASLSLFVRQLKSFRILAFVLFFWSFLMAAAVYFKSNNYFNSKFFDKVLAKTIHYQWGWIVMLVAVLLLITSVRKIRLEENKI